jgi:hypothetical protein
VDSSRALIVGAISAIYSTVDRVKRIAAIEREHLEDLVAEGRARFEARKAAAAARAAGTTPAVEGLRAVEVPRRGRAA